ncbi:hypothetical protein AAFG07_34710 [Bradyrhizobium sp. B097]|uniref:hypothetical protein n=1 Tax=Bradyrhizobium sp. B097 TaxID=3140244 RepID=UPI003183D3C1
MPAATAYVLHVPEGRRDIILNYAEENRYDATRYVAEPVPSFSYGRNALVVLACFRDGAITHIADGRKGMSAGTGLARLNMPMTARDPSLAARLARLSENRARVIRGLTSKERENANWALLGRQK